MASDEDGDPLEIEGLDLSDPVSRAQLAGHLELVRTAWRFLETAVRDGDLRAVWGMVDNALRTQLAQQWVVDNHSEIVAYGFNEDAVVAGLADENPTHELWVHFERVHVRSLRQVMPSSDSWGIGSKTRVVGPDLEALYVHDLSKLPPDGVWRPGAISEHLYPIVFRRAGDEWLLAMLGPNDLLDDI